MFNWLKKIFVPAPDATHAIQADASSEKEKARQNLETTSGLLHKAQGDTWLEQGNWEKAVDCYRQATSVMPANTAVRINLGFALKELQKYDEAKNVLVDTLAIDPKIADAHYILGMIAEQRQQFDTALQHFEKTAQIKPDFAIVYHDLYKLLFQQNRIGHLKHWIMQGIDVNPGDADLHFYLGNIYSKEEQPDQAIACFRKSIEIAPNRADILGNLGFMLQSQKKYQEAQTILQQALILQPEFANAHNTMGLVLQAQSQFEQALASYQQAIIFNPDYAEAYINIGNTLQEQKKLPDALAAHQKALAIRPDFADAHWNISLISLLQGNFTAGWPGYEYRWQTLYTKQQRHFTQPLWLGDEDIAGKSILLHAEQGYGDTLQFIRYTEHVARLGAKVILEVPPALTSLVSSITGVTHLIARGEALPYFDYHCPLLSLPLAFKTDFSTIPATTPYISAPANRVQHWAEQLQQHTSRRIGIVWSGNPEHKNDHNRSIPLALLLPLLQNTTHHFFCLQKVVSATDTELLQTLPSFNNLSTHLHDFAETAAIIANLDMVITVDTSVAHLAGALGKPVWIMLPFVPDWRWLLDCSDNPWYPSVRLFRQSSSSKWGPVIDEIQTALGSFTILNDRMSQTLEFISIN